MPRVLALTRYGELGSSSRVRHHEFVEPLARRGIDVDVAPLLGDSYLEARYSGAQIDRRAVLGSYARRVRHLLSSRRYDVVWLEKEALPWVPGPVEAALTSRRTPLVVDVDDLWADRYESLGSPWARRLLADKFTPVLRRAALVTAANETLAADLRERGARHVEVVPGSLDLRRYPAPVAPPAQFTVGWIGSPLTAARYLPALVEPLGRLVAQGEARVLLIGADDAVPTLEAERVNWSYDTEVAQMSRASVGIMPLDDDDFSRAKSGYKLVQFMAVGRPIVASPVGINVALVGDGDRGSLADSAQGWEDALLALARNPDDAAAKGIAARRYVEAEYDLEVRADQVADILRRAATMRP